jgi:hypothetical protein
MALNCTGAAAFVRIQLSGKTRGSGGGSAADGVSGATTGDGGRVTERKPR